MYERDGVYRNNYILTLTIISDKSDKKEYYESTVNILHF